MREMGEETGDLRPRIRRAMEAKAHLTRLARGGKCGYRFSVEDVVAGHWAMDRGKWVGIEVVAGLSEENIAGVLCMTLAEFIGGGDQVKDGQIGFGACCFSDVGESGGDGWI